MASSTDQKPDPILFNYAHSLVIVAEEFFRLSKKTQHTFQEFSILLQESIDRNMDMEHLISGLKFLFDGNDQYVTKVRVFLQEHHKMIPETKTEEKLRSKSVEEEEEDTNISKPKRCRSKSTSVVCEEEAGTSTRKHPSSRSEEEKEEDTNISTPKRTRSKSTSVVCEEVETSTRKHPCLRSKKEKEESPFEKKVRTCVGFIDQVRLNLQDEVKYKSFLNIITRFQKHEDVDHVKKEVLPLFTKHLALELDFSRYILS